MMVVPSWSAPLQVICSSAVKLLAPGPLPPTSPSSSAADQAHTQEISHPAGAEHRPGEQNVSAPTQQEQHAGSASTTTRSLRFQPQGGNSICPAAARLRDGTADASRLRDGTADAAWLRDDTTRHGSSPALHQQELVINMVLIDLNLTPPEEEDSGIPGGGHVDQHGDINMEAEGADQNGDINMEEDGVDPGQDAVGEQNLVHCNTHTACEFIPVKNVRVVKLTS